MARRHASLVETLRVLPWWVAPIVGVLGYVVIVVVARMIVVDEPGSLAPSAQPFALPWLVLCLVVGAGNAIRAVLARRSDRRRGGEDMRALSWRQFEALVAEGFRRRGFRVRESGDASDEGIDFVLHRGAETFLVQGQQWKTRKVDVRPIRELSDAVRTRAAAGGYFITAGVYTEGAREFAREAGIELLDGPALEQLVLDARRPEPFLDPTLGRRHTAIYAAPAAPRCPKCQGAMVLRTTERGATSRRDYWGCLQSPVCRGRIDL